VSPSLLTVQNHSGSTPLHWAALNGHLPVLQALVQFHGGPGAALIDIKNAAGRSPLGEAEATGWEEGAKWLVEMMRVDPDNVEKEEGDDGDGDESAPARDLQTDTKTRKGETV
jgi:ankyrin repeat protein